MNTHFYWLVIIVLLTRLYFLFQKTSKSALSFRKAFSLFLVRCLSLLFVYQWSVVHLWYLLPAFGISASAWLLEKYWATTRPNTTLADGSTSSRLDLIRFFSFLLFFLFIGKWSITAGNPRLSHVAQFVVTLLKSNTTLPSVFHGISPSHVGALTMGLFFATTEANVLFRLIFDFFQITHPTKTNDLGETDGEKEYNNGRMIGFLERVLVYLCILAGKYEAIGFIMAAKAFARFKKLDKQSFAEYVLIGSLLSIVLSVLAALLVKRLLLVP